MNCRALIRCVMHSLVFLTLAGGAVAQETPAATSDSPPPAIYKLSGTVINSVTGEPIPRALVELSQSPQHAMLTGRDGTFEFDSLPAGEATLLVRKPGFFGSGAPMNPVRRSFVQVGQDTPPVIARLTPESIVTGRVTDTDGLPIEGAMVQVLGTYVANGKRMPLPQLMSRADEDGNFRIAGLTAGRYNIVVHPGRNVFGGGGLLPARQGFPVSVYYPGAPDISSASPLDIGAGKTMEVDFSIKPVAVYKLAFRVTGGSERENVQLLDASGQNSFLSARRLPGGSYEVEDVPAGSYILRVTGLDANRRDGSGLAVSDTPINVTGDLSGFALAAPVPVSVPVVIRTEFTRNQTQGSCTFFNGNDKQAIDCNSLPAARVELRSDLPGAGFTFLSDMQAGDDPSQATIRNIVPGRYSVRIYPVRQGYIQSAQSGDADLLRDSLVVPAGGQVPPIEITLRDDAASLDGNVSLQTAQRSWVVLVPQQGSLDPQLIQADTTGHFQTANLPPGAYKLFAFDSVDDLEYSNPAVLAQYSSKAGSVTVSANGKSSVTLELIHAGDGQ